MTALRHTFFSACAWFLSATFSVALSAAEGYHVISPPQPRVTAVGEEVVEVVELFSYACPHCHQFEPYIETWLKTKPANVSFVRVPVIFRPEWEIFAKAFYTAEALGLLDKIHGQIFTAVHNNKRPLNTESAMAAFFGEFGVSKEEFERTFNSFTVLAKVKRAKEITQNYRINETPAMVVNGAYRIDSTVARGNFNFLLSKVTELTQRVRKEGQLGSRSGVKSSTP